VNLSKMGSCEFWDPEPWIDAANILTAADDPLLALKLLDMVPAYYRQSPDGRIETMRKKILGKLVTTNWYATCEDVIATPEQGEFTCLNTRRGVEMCNEVKRLNEKGLTPTIIELAPGTYWLPIGMKALGLKFCYYPITLNKQIIPLADSKIHFCDLEFHAGPVIYCAFELIEHLHHEDDIQVDIERLGIKPDLIHLSTPYCTYDGRLESLDWSNKDLGHIRTYAPIDFINVARKMFKQYNWTVIPEQVMHLRGELNVDFKL